MLLSRSKVIVYPCRAKRQPAASIRNPIFSPVSCSPSAPLDKQPHKSGLTAILPARQEIKQQSRLIYDKFDFLISRSPVRFLQVTSARSLLSRPHLVQSFPCPMKYVACKLQLAPRWCTPVNLLCRARSFEAHPDPSSVTAFRPGRRISRLQQSVRPAKQTG